jgi:hypothetical protein
MHQNIKRLQTGILPANNRGTGLPEMSTARKRVFEVGLWAAAALTLLLGVLPAAIAPTISESDKVEHVVAFAVLSLMAIRAYGHRSFLLLGICLSAFGAAIEIVQAIPWIHRYAELNDWVADSLSIAAVLLTAALVRRVRQPA